MKNKLFSLFLIMLASLGALWAQEVQVGAGTEINKHLPIDPWFGYSYSQQIYLASEIGDSDGGMITAIKFYYHGDGISNSNEWTVYIGHTTKTEFTSTTDWVDVSTLDQVFSGNIGTVSADGWVTIDINDWSYNGTDNIIIAVDENQSGYDESGDDFYCTATTTNRAIEYHNDNTNPDPANPPTASALHQAFANIIFVGLEADCPAPLNPSVNQTSETEADLAWDANGGNQWEIEYGPQGFAHGSGTTVSGITQPSYHLTGLSVGNYDYYVRADCGGGTYSNWSQVTSWTQVYANNDCANAMTLSVYPQGGGAGNEVTQNTEYSTPSSMSHTSCDSYGDNYDLFYSFTAPSSGTVKVITAGSAGNNIEAALYDSCGGTELDCKGSGSEKEFDGLTPGNTYILQIWHDSGNIGEFNIVMEEACPAPSNLSTVVTSDTEATLSWDANGASEWELEYGPQGFSQGSGTTVTGITQPSYQLTGLTLGSDYDYYVRATCGTDFYSDWIGPHSWNQTPPPANDACQNATEIASLPYNISEDATAATNNDGFITICSNSMNDGVWFKFTVDQVNGDITVTADPTGWDNQLDIYSGTDCSNLTCVQYADDHGSGTAETITFTPTAGTTYYINVGYWSGNTDGSEGPFTLDISGDVTLHNSNMDIEGFALYPNPTTGLIQWTASTSIDRVVLFDATGKELMRINRPAQNKLDISAFPQGTYILRVTSGDRTQSVLVMKK